jgi:hypothetical protein
MNKKLAVFITMVAALCLMLSPAFAKGGKTGQAGKSETAHLVFGPFGDDPAEPDAYGKIKYDLVDGPFVANAHGLTRGTYYGLYSGSELLGMDMAKGSGNVHFQGSIVCTELGSYFNIWEVEVSNGVVDKVERILRTTEEIDCL